MPDPSEGISDEELDSAAHILAIHFHDTYERLAPEFSYTTRTESAVPWADVPEANRGLMVATVRIVLADLIARIDASEARCAEKEKIIASLRDACTRGSNGHKLTLSDLAAAEQRIERLEGAIKPFVDYWTHDEDYDDEIYERPHADQYDALVAVAFPLPWKDRSEPT